jgi:hypothetical protein
VREAFIEAWTYESVTEAAVCPGVPQNYILDVYQKRIKLSKGFGWRFADPEEEGLDKNSGEALRYYESVTEVCV